MKYIYHHLGLGDALICNGLVRVLISNEPREKYVIFTKHHNYKTVKFMYHDESRINVMSVADDNSVYSYLKDKNKSDIIQIGFNHINEYGNIPFDITFYNQMNIPFDMKWSAFRYKRDRIRQEKELFEKFTNNDDDEYIFVHDDPTRGQINPEYLKNKHIIRPIIGLTDNIFDYVYIIEKAKEIHCIDSSFLHLIDQLEYLKSPLFFHKYSRKYVKSIYNPVPYLNGLWNILI